MSDLTTIAYDPPRVNGSRVEFSFRTTPASPAFRANQFHFQFPTSFDLEAVPERVWWLVLLLCCHPQWPLLRPCRIELPVGLPPDEIEFWLRLGDAALSTLHAYRGEPPPPRQIEIVTAGAVLPDPEPLADNGRAAVAFSSGKDSLLHAALLREFAERPILVATTSPIRELHDHHNSWRRTLLETMARRQDFEFVEVTSDIRGSWENAWTANVGHPIVAISLLTDTFVYLSSLLVVAWLRGASHLFVASEAEVQASVERDGRVVQHSHFMYSAATQRSVAALLRPLGISFGSLTWGLPSALVMRLLWRRYPDLAGFQFSCWRVDERQPACSRCTQCLRLAFQIMEAGGDPARAGFDLVQLAAEFPDWAVAAPSADALPLKIAGYGPRRHVARSIARLSPFVMAYRTLRPVGRITPAPRGERWRAVARLLRLRWRTRWARRLPPPLAHAGFLALTDPLLREPLLHVVRSHCDIAAESDHDGTLARSLSLTDWIAAPLRARAARQAP